MTNSKYYSPRHFALITITGLFFLSGCSFKTDQYSHDILVAKEFRVVKNNSIDHTIIYDYIMKSDGYIIGIEKTRGVGEYITKCSDESFEKVHANLCETVSSHNHSFWLPDFLEKRMILTHVVSFSSSEQLDSTCVLFNAQSNIQRKSNLVSCSNARINSGTNKFEYMEEAINSIDLLKNNIRSKIKKIHPTHIFLVSTGWNTPQGESIKNYNDLFKHVENANRNKGKFVPLVVGISWKSYMDNPLQGSGDFPTVQNDADEVGIFWAAPILHNVLEPLGAEYAIPVRLIGHSFGCRVVTQALSSKNLYETVANTAKPVLYGLQCAFSGYRFLSKQTGKRSEDDSLENFKEVSDKQFYTTSKFDKAVQKPAEKGIPYIGSNKFFEEVSDDKDRDFEKIITQSTIESSGKYIPKLDCQGDKLTLIDASAIINEQAPGTGEGGGAHSDVWDDDAGALIWDLLKVCEYRR